MADTDVAQSGSAHGAAAQGDKRKREVDDVRDRSMDIDKLTEVKSVGAMLSRMSRVDPEIDNWAKSINEQNAGQIEGSPSGVAHGDAAGGNSAWKQIDRDLIEARKAFLQLLPENRRKSDGRPDPGVAHGDAGGGLTLGHANKVDVMEIYSPTQGHSSD